MASDTVTSSPSVKSLIPPAAGTATVHGEVVAVPDDDNEKMGGGSGEEACHHVVDNRISIHGDA